MSNVVGGLASIRDWVDSDAVQRPLGE